MMLDEIALWILILIGSSSLVSLALLAVVIRLFYRSLEKQTDIINQIKHLSRAASGILELEEDD